MLNATTVSLQTEAPSYNENESVMDYDNKINKSSQTAGAVQVKANLPEQPCDYLDFGKLKCC